MWTEQSPRSGAGHCAAECPIVPASYPYRSASLHFRRQREFARRVLRQHHQRERSIWPRSRTLSCRSFEQSLDLSGERNVSTQDDVSRDTHRTDRPSLVKPTPQCGHPTHADHRAKGEREKACGADATAQARADWFSGRGAQDPNLAAGAYLVLAPPHASRAS